MDVHQQIVNQVKSRCIHLNGMQNPHCEAGVAYASFGGFMNRPCCFGGKLTNCKKASFLTGKQADERATEIEAEIRKAEKTLKQYAKANH